MELTSRFFWLHCLSPLHIGSGEGIGVIDMPIQREKVTEWPMIPGSSLKGVHRDYYRLNGKNEAWINKAFGQAGDQDGAAGALVMTDGRILAFPVASRYGTFAYVTCPLVLKRLRRDAQAAGLAMDIPDLEVFESETAGADEVWVSESSVIRSGEKEKLNIFLDEFEGKASVSTSFTKWAITISNYLFEDAPSRELWTERLALVSDEVFQYFTTMCCEVTPRIRINEDTKTTVKGALWYEEYVPTEAVFYGLIWCDRVGGSFELQARNQLLEELEDSTLILQLGGNTTIGKGRTRFLISGGCV
ncbi:type III-B CRISPR module RAMP protein Cmr4 [Paenibacillus amylolyticus]|uniref:Type III-B CRISPR module RAMP protein Cmr4 n=1 Tax=Paenibacillus amylolyticus TaxID=1451 RepID=A0ABD8B2I3_PAEAM